MELTKKSDVEQLQGTALREAADDLGVSYSDNTQDKTIRKKIMEMLGIADNVEEGGQQDDSPAETQTKRPFSEKVKINITRDKDDKQPVPVAVNGRVFRIARGVDVEVPKEVLSVLDDAIQVIMELEEDSQGKEHLVAKEVPAYNYRLVSK